MIQYIAVCRSKERCGFFNDIVVDDLNLGLAGGQIVHQLTGTDGVISLSLMYYSSA